MSRRYTGAEALELVAKATKRPWTAGEMNADDEVPVFVTDRSIVRAVVIAVNDSPEENAALCAAAPDLAESLAAVEAERDEAQGAYLSLEANYNAQHTTLLALEAERDALRAAVRDMRDAEHALGVLRMKGDETPGSVCEHEHTRMMDRRDHLTAELCELAGLREATGMTRLAYAEKIMREFIAAYDGLDSCDGGSVEKHDDAVEAIREAVK